MQKSENQLLDDVDSNTNEYGEEYNEEDDESEFSEADEIAFKQEMKAKGIHRNKYYFCDWCGFPGPGFPFKRRMHPDCYWLASQAKWAAENDPS